MKRLICYCHGGIGNRLRPLASCEQLAEMSGRKLFVHWENSYRCEAHLKELFVNDFEYLAEEEMLKLNSYEIYCSRESAQDVYKITRKRLLMDLIEVNDTAPIGANEMKLDDPKENVLILSNGFLRNTDMRKNEKFIKNLIPTKFIQDNVDLIARKLDINKNMIGVHARGSDFQGQSFTTLIGHCEPRMVSMLKKNPHVKFLVCSDDLSLEQYLLNKYPKNIITNNEKPYVEKHDPTKSWVDNTKVTAMGAKHAIVDMFLLAKTNFAIYNPESSFAELVKILQKD